MMWNFIQVKSVRLYYPFNTDILAFFLTKCSFKELSSQLVHFLKDFKKSVTKIVLNYLFSGNTRQWRLQHMLYKYMSISHRTCVMFINQQFPVGKTTTKEQTNKQTKKHNSGIKLLFFQDLLFQKIDLWKRKSVMFCHSLKLQLKQTGQQP